MTFCSKDDENDKKNKKVEQDYSEQTSTENDDTSDDESDDTSDDESDDTSDDESDDTSDDESDDNISYVPKIEEIEGTITNKRPLTYKKGNMGGVFNKSVVSDPQTWNASQFVDANSGDEISRFQTSLMNINYDTREWYVDLGDQSKGNAGPGYDLNMNDDGTMEIVIYLRNDIYWTDNTRMTADDWVFYWNEIKLNEEIGSNGYSTTIIEVDGEYKSIVAEKIDEFTFKYIFPKAVGNPELPLSDGVMPKHILEPILKSKGPEGIIQMWGIDTPVSELIGYGPWILESYTPGQNIIYKRNDEYFKKDDWDNSIPYLDKYIVNIVSDENSEMIRFQNKEISAVNFKNTEFNNMIEKAESEGYSVWNGGPTEGILFVTFNQNPNSDRMKGRPQLDWFRSKHFRQAINYMIDKEDLVLKVLNGLGEPDKGPLHPASPYFNPDNTFPNEYDPQEALRILEENFGMRDRDGNGILEDENGEELRFELLTAEGSDDFTSSLSIISSGCNAYGVKILPDTIDFSNLVQKLMANYDWESVIMGLSGGIWPASGANVWRSSANLHFWNPFQETPSTEWEADIDMIFDEAIIEPDFEVRKDLWDEMYSIVYEELPYILLYRPYSLMAIYDEWENVNWDTVEEIGGANAQFLYQR